MIRDVSLYVRTLGPHLDRLVGPDGSIDLNLCEELLATHGPPDLNEAETVVAVLREVRDQKRIWQWPAGLLCACNLSRVPDEHQTTTTEDGVVHGYHHCRGL